MMVLRAFRAISDLKMTVEGGLVVGVAAARTPKGSAMYLMPGFP